MSPYAVRRILGVALLAVGGCSGGDESRSGSGSGDPESSDRSGFVLRTGGGEILQNGIIVKLSPENGTEGSILVEQTFPQGGSTILHLHEQGDELFYVVAGRGTATLSGTTHPIGPSDVVFVPRRAAHSIQNLESSDPLTVVFFMDSPELVQQFRAIHERTVADPADPPTAEELAQIEERYGGGVALSEPDGDDSQNR